MRLFRPNQLHDFGAGIIIGLLLLAVAGGGTYLGIKGGGFVGLLNKFTVTQSQIDGAKAGYAGVQVWMIRYRCLYDNAPLGCVDGAGHKLPQNRCPPEVHASLANLCGEKAIVERIQTIDKAVLDQFAIVDADYADCVAGSPTGTCTGLTAAYKAVQEAISAAKAFGMQFGFTG